MPLPMALSPHTDIRKEALCRLSKSNRVYTRMQALAVAMETAVRENKRAGARKVMIEKRKEEAERQAAMQERKEEQDRLLQARLADAAEEERRRQERCATSLHTCCSHDSPRHS